METETPKLPKTQRKKGHPGVDTLCKEKVDP